MKLVSLTLAAILGTALVLPAMAQSTTWHEDEEVGYEYGYNPPPKQYRFSRANTAGWHMMSPEEKMAYHQKMWDAKTFDECVSIQTKNQVMMQKRAQEKNVALTMPRKNACENMQKAGKFK